MKRREFMTKSALSAAALSRLGHSFPFSTIRLIDGARDEAGPQPSPPLNWEKDAPSNQKLNMDYITYLPGVEYFYLGNGDIQAVVQYCKDHRLAGDSSFFGLTLIDPERLTQKWTTFLYRPSDGFGSTRMWIWIDGVLHSVDNENFNSIEWIYDGAVPVVRMKWNAGSLRVEEDIFVPKSEPVLFRRARVTNLDNRPHDLVTGLRLYPNIALFDDIYTDPREATANAEGFATVQLQSLEGAAKTFGRYDVRVDAGEVQPGKEALAIYAYRIGRNRKKLTRRDFASLWSATDEYWKSRNTVSTGVPNFDHIWKLGRTGIRAQVARSGKRDGGNWEYCMEWAADNIMALKAALMAGFYDEAKDLIVRILEKLISSDGRTVESSQVFDFQFTEINQNGMILYGIWIYIAWTGDYSIIRKHWNRIKALADLPLRPYFWDKKSGLLTNSREFWERSTIYGVKPGFELGYQFWVSIGLDRISQIARKLGHAEDAARWHSASQSIENAFLHDKKYRLIEDGHFIKRRTLDGEWQKTFVPPDRSVMPEGTPIATEKEPLAEPDATEVFPIVFGMIDAKSELSLKTLAWVESLWNQRWTIGGYERYDSSSEPEPPGPWPLASLIIAEAYWEAGNYQKGMRVVDWLNNINGKISGGWFEYYPEGHPGVGIVAWTWMECIRLTVHHMLGVRPEPDRLVIRPRPAPGMKDVKARIRVRNTEYEINVKSGAGETGATVDSRKVTMHDGAITIPYSRKSKSTIEINLPSAE